MRIGTETGVKNKGKRNSEGLILSGGKNIYREKACSDVACGLIPTLKQRQKMNTDRKKTIKEAKKKERKKSKCQANIKSES